MEQLMDWDFLQEAGARTILVTETRLAGQCEQFPRLVEVLLALLYIRPPRKDPDLLEGELDFCCSMHYLQSPYTFAAVFHLWQTGYYYEAAILERHLVEALLQVRFFHRHPDLIWGHLSGRTRVQFSRMFDEVAPDARRMYKTLSNVAHGGLSKDLFRVDRSSPPKGRLVMGSEYKETWASFTMNVANGLIYGFLKYYPECFSVADQVAASPELEGRYRKGLAWLEETFRGHIRAKPDTEEWYRSIATLIGWGPD